VGLLASVSRFVLPLIIIVILPSLCVGPFPV
jgi:hypothetical protein